MLPFRDERIICGVPTLPHFVDIKVSDNPNSCRGLWYYITHNFSQFIRLAAIPAGPFGMQRDYYSSGHNVYLAIYFTLSPSGTWWHRQLVEAEQILVIVLSARDRPYLADRHPSPVMIGTTDFS